MTRVKQESGQAALVERKPTAAEYRRLCESVGWGQVMNFDAAAEALPRSLHAVVAYKDGEAVGMGRIVGDGAIFFYIQDVAVDPRFQGQGIGQCILEALIGWVRKHAPEKAFLGLFAASGTLPFYERFGFASHSGLVGVFQVVHPVRGIES